MTHRTTRRDAIRALGASAVAAALPKSASAQMAQGHREVRAGTPPLQGIRVIERSATLAGRLCGLLLADQGAEVLIARDGPTPFANDMRVALDDAYFDRGKVALPAGTLDDTASADIVIIDGAAAAPRAPHQILVRIVTALPGDRAYGHLAPDASEDLVNALCGFFTNMSLSGPLLGRPVIYTPIPLPSVYCGVNAAVGAVACLVDRLRTGLGRELYASRIAGGLSAIGALSLTSEGLPPQLDAIQVGGLPPGLAPEQFRQYVAESLRDPARQMWFERRFGPLSTPYRTKDGRWFVPMAGPNGRLSKRLLTAMGLWDEALATGVVVASPYDPAILPDRRRNLQDSLALGWTYTDPIATLLERAFLTRTAAEWERFLQAHGSAGSIIMSWEEWQRDAEARQAAIFAEVDGAVQIGRTNWMQSAQPYAPLALRRTASALPARAAAVPAPTGRAAARRPLEGYRVTELTNVLAGPCCSRMLGELGCDVTRVDVTDPQQGPTIHVVWSGENSAGKKSIIVDRLAPRGRAIIHQLAARSDIVCANMMDDQFARLGLDPASLWQLNPRAIGLQITATRGERIGPRHNDKGYDPSIQGTTGLMMRFGGPETPTFHGIASAVDYITGYLGTLSGVLALYARERRADGKGDWTETSLCNAATLIQLLHQRPGSEAPASARGQLATGRSATERVHQLSDGWIFAQATRDISGDLRGRTQAEALAWCRAQAIPATEVQTCQQLADRHRAAPTATVTFEKTTSDGWSTENFAPSWFAFEGRPERRPAAATRIGSDGPAVLRALGYNDDQVRELIAAGIVGRTEWARS